MAVGRGPVLLRRRATCAPGRWRPTCAAELRERFGGAWFDEPEAGAFLRELWSAGQGAAGGEGILERVGGAELDFGAVRAEVQA